MRDTIIMIRRKELERYTLKKDFGEVISKMVNPMAKVFTLATQTTRS